MSVNDSTFGFPVADLMTRVIPGFLTISPFLVAVLFHYDGFPVDTTLLLVTVILSSLMMGEIIDQVRTTIFRVPIAFQRFIYNETGDPDRRPTYDEYREKIEESPFGFLLPNRGNSNFTPVEDRLNMDFRSEIESVLGVDFEEDSTRDIYDLFLLHLDPTVRKRTKRQQIISTMTSNLTIGLVSITILFVGTLFSIGLSFLINRTNLSALIFVFIGSLQSIANLIFFYIAREFLNSSKYNFTEYLFKEFYLNHN